MARRPSSRFRFDWTEERIGELLKLRESGLSASQIAERLGDGVSRSAVIGRLHRLNARPKARPAPKPKPKRKRKPERRVEPPVPMTINRPQLTSEQNEIVVGAVLALRPEQCRFPLGEISSSDFRFCEAMQFQEGNSYCETHSAIAHQPPAVREAVQRRAERQSRSAL